MKKSRFMIYFIVIIMGFILSPVNVKANEYFCNYYSNSGGTGAYSETLTISTSDDDNKIYVTFSRYNKVVGRKEDVSGLVSRQSIIGHNCPSGFWFNETDFVLRNNRENFWHDGQYLFDKKATGTGVVTENPILIGYTGGVGNLVFNDSMIASGGCTSNSGVFKLFKIAYNLLKIASPIILIIFGMLDMAKAVTSSDEGKMKKAQSAFVRRLIAAVIVFLSFVIVEFIVRMLSNSSDIMNCVNELF